MANNNVAYKKLPPPLNLWSPTFPILLGRTGLEREFKLKLYAHDNQKPVTLK